jgi:hypothetical protein
LAEICGGPANYGFNNFGFEELVNCYISLVLNLLNQGECLFLQSNAPPEKILENIPYSAADINRLDCIGMVTHSNNSRSKLARTTDYRQTFKRSEDNCTHQACRFRPIQ